MNSYTKMIKQWERDSKRKMKLEKKLAEEQQKREEQLTSRLIHARFLEEQREAEKRQIEVNNKSNFLNEIINKLDYREYLTIRDMIFNDFYQIKADLQKNKINMNIIKKVTEILKQNNFIDNNNEQILYNVLTF